MNDSKGFSLIELLIVVAIILVIAAIAIPNMLRTKMSANEAAAVAALRNIHNSQAVYILQYGAGASYANTLTMLGPPAAGAACNVAHACLVDNVIGCAVMPCAKSGYNYFLTSSFSTRPFFDYTSTATPIDWDKTGHNNYCTADDGAVRRQLSPAGTVGGVLRADCVDGTQYEPLH